MGAQADLMMNAMRSAPASERFDYISERARPYPSFLLGDCETALSVFAAGFLGWNDAIHFARAGMTCECVDTDKERMWEMASVYPQGWAFHVQDAWEFADHATELGLQWDVVSVDPFFGDASEKVWETAYLWIGLARRLVTLTVKPDTILNIPIGWKSSIFPRNDRAAWMVLTRA